MRTIAARTRLWAPAALLPVLVLSSCFGGGGSLSPNDAKTAGDFQVVGINIAAGQVWELNRPIRIEFNHPVDPGSIGFSSILIQATSPAIAGRPVTGSFELEAGTGDRVVVFRPSCPTNDAYDNGAFLPGGYDYRVELPTAGSYGSSVLRDTAGHQLKSGIQRSFRTPIPPGEPLFLDVSPFPPSIIGIDWPERLNMFTDPEPIIAIHFDQAIDGRSANLNTDRIFVQYSDELVSSGGTPTFQATSLVPGTVELSQNCTKQGATLYFQISGLLPPDRSLRLTMANTFRDIAGQTQIETWTSAHHATPKLEDVYGASALGFTEADPTLDEFSDFFADSTMIDMEAGLTLPPANWTPGGVTAGFDFPGRFVSEEDDFYWDEPTGEIMTDGQSIITDSNNRAFTIQNGVLYVNDFEIEAGRTLRGRGTNPLVIYATGEVQIYGTLDCSGNDSHWPTSLNSPQFPEGPVLGECGGGLGGIASLQGLMETTRGEPGDGPFGLTGLGGGGGEGGFNQSQNIGGSSSKSARLITGGGGGGTFALTSNLAIHVEWPKTTHRPNGADKKDPDHDPDRSPYWPDGVFRDPVDPYTFPVYGGEDGMRGSSSEAPDSSTTFDPNLPPSLPHGTYGMEDEMIDQLAPGKTDPAAGGTFDPYWNSLEIPFDYGHPTDGPDKGLAGSSVFSADGNTDNDFFGSRYDPVNGTVTRGELLTPWAGSGGGASGDSQEIYRKTVNGVMTPVIDNYPARPFPPANGYYRKGCPGGGGGGQLQILAIGQVLIGGTAKIDVDGGIGHGGESTIYSYGQISGSGGGSGGHAIIHSASKLNLIGVNVGSGSQFSDLTPVDTVRAVGGRRGWAGSWCTRLHGYTNVYDGNGDLMIGRGGAGGNGVIQFHVPDPANDIVWPIASRSLIRDHIHEGNLNNPVNVDKLEEAYDLFASPRPYALLPFFSARSQVQSKWIDTGLAGLRDPANGTGPYPDWASSMAAFAGISTSDGKVEKQGPYVKPLDDILSIPVADADYSSESVVISSAAALFSGLEYLLRSPELLAGYDLLPDEQAAASSYEITGGSYDPVADELTLTTSSLDGSLLFALNPPNDSSLRPKYFRVSTTGSKDYLPSSTAVAFEFQGADDPDDSGTYTTWTSDLASLQGKRAVRFRVNFDIDADGATGGGVTQASPRPTLEYVKLPFEW